MGNLDPLCSSVILSTIAAMALGFFLVVLGGRLLLVGILFAGGDSCFSLVFEHVACFLSACAKNDLLQAMDRRVLVPDEIRQVRKCLQCRCEFPVTVFTQNRSCPFEVRLEFFHIEVDPVDVHCDHTSHSLPRKSFVSGYPRTSFNGRLGLLVWSSLPRPVVSPSTVQFAAR